MEGKSEFPDLSVPSCPLWRILAIAATDWQSKTGPAKRAYYPLRGTEDTARQRTVNLNMLVPLLLGLLISAAPASAEIEQCRFIQAKAEREACYTRQEAALAAKRKPEPRADTGTIESLQQMRREDAEVYRSMRGICRGC